MKNKILAHIKTKNTPFYFYDIELLEKTLTLIKEAANFHKYHIHYALKANCDQKILEIIKNYDFGADCVSGNEILKANEIGFQKEKIVFAGVGKTDNEILIALKKDIFCFNCESIAEMKVIQEIAKKQTKIANIAIRTNPDIEANTHHYITTGLEENKFGISRWELEEVISYINKASNLNLVGLHFHIGSQITDLNVFKNLCVRVNEFQNWFEQKNIFLQHINLGGGLGINYLDAKNNSVCDFQSFFNIFKTHLELRNKQELHFELGRSIVGQCGSLISKVLYLKKGIKTQFLIIDAGMTELLRPALYQSTHKIENLSAKTSNIETYDVVGPICESSDCFGKRINLPSTKRNDIIRIMSCGAYGQVMASQYNLRPLVKSVYSDEIIKRI